jgi:putative aminopeptidase FrvX
VKRLLMAAMLVLPCPAVAQHRAVPQPPTSLDDVRSVLAPLIETYGVSGAEGPVRDAVTRMLPAWARASTDSAGNLIVSVGEGGPLVVFVAHLDEIGFVISAIRDDGTLELTPRGGFFLSLFEAQPALVHTEDRSIPGIFLPRDSLGTTPRRTPAPFRADVGAGSRAGVEAMGIRVGHTLTMPKQFVPLAGTRATGRSFDDRVGCTALLLALRRIDPKRLHHRVIFVWSVREETGLEGARVVADALGLTTARVHAVDTFVSSDSPLEIKTFADVPLGSGAVARALDNSSVTPPALVDSLVRVAVRRNVPLQVGSTNGGNDGSVFASWGVPDVPLAWPLRYAHSPAEVIDLKDVQALARLIQAVAEDW